MLYLLKDIEAFIDKKMKILEEKLAFKINIEISARFQQLEKQIIKTLNQQNFNDNTNSTLEYILESIIECKIEQLSQEVHSLKSQVEKIL